MQCEASNHSARLAIHQVYVFVARSISSEIESGDHVTEVLLKLRRRAKGKLSNP